jgi:hypothetical protein
MGDEAGTYTFDRVDKDLGATKQGKTWKGYGRTKPKKEGAFAHATGRIISIERQSPTSAPTFIFSGCKYPS